MESIWSTYSRRREYSPERANGVQARICRKLRFLAVVRIPPNLRFRVPRDYESMWALGEDSFDLIHLRNAYGGISQWMEMYQKIFV